MKKIIALCALSSAVLLSGCILPSKGPAFSMLTLNQNFSEAGVDNSVRPLRTGTSNSGGILFINSGDSSITAAMRNGNISKVHHVDYKVNNYFWLWHETTTTVYGE